MDENGQDRISSINADAWSVKRFMSLLIRRWKEAEKVAKKNNKPLSFREPWFAVSDALLRRFWDTVQKKNPKRKPQQIQQILLQRDGLTIDRL